MTQHMIHATQNDEQEKLNPVSDALNSLPRRNQLKIASDVLDLLIVTTMEEYSELSEALCLIVDALEADLEHRDNLAG